MLYPVAATVTFAVKYLNELNNVLSHFISQDKCRLTQKL